ncbi:hydrolase [Paramyrothecium foliicola]|nr:hydrolase [Paramyrothecium foliicola]
MPPRIPTEADFSPLASTLPVALHFPDPPESTTAFLVLFHGLGDHETPFAGFAKNLSLPGVMAISVRGTAPLPPSLLPDVAAGGPPRHFHWGDDLALDTATGDLDEDPGFTRAAQLVMDKLVKGVLVETCGWETSDVILFGFGQGGSLALGLASRLRAGDQVVDVTDGPRTGAGSSFKGVVSLGGPLPPSMVPSRSARDKSATHVLLCQVGEEDVDFAKREFSNVTVVRWRRPGIGMPQSREEVLPIMQFFAERLKSGW